MGAASSRPTQPVATPAPAPPPASACQRDDELDDTRAQELLKKTLDAVRPGQANSPSADVLFKLLLREWANDAKLSLPPEPCSNPEKVMKQLRRNKATKEAMNLFRSAPQHEKAVLTELERDYSIAMHARVFNIN